MNLPLFLDGFLVQKKHGLILNDLLKSKDIGNKSMMFIPFREPPCQVRTNLKLLSIDLLDQHPLGPCSGKS